MTDDMFHLDQPSPELATNLTHLTGMKPLSPRAAQIGRALANVARSTSIPLREPVYGRPSYWSKPLLEMRARIVPPTTVWTPYITLQGGIGNFPAGYAATVQYWISTSLVDPATSGVIWRFLYNGTLMDANSFVLLPGVDLNVERSATIPNPWPAQVRRIAMSLMNNDQFVLQFQNTSGINQRALGTLSGYYWPNLAKQDRGGLELGERNEDASRSITPENAYDTGH